MGDVTSSRAGGSTTGTDAGHGQCLFPSLTMNGSLMLCLLTSSGKGLVQCDHHSCWTWPWPCADVPACVGPGPGSCCPRLRACGRAASPTAEDAPWLQHHTFIMHEMEVSGTSDFERNACEWCVSMWPWQARPGGCISDRGTGRHGEVKGMCPHRPHVFANRSGATWSFKREKPKDVTCLQALGRGHVVLKFIQDAVLHFTSHRSRSFLCSAQGRASSRPERRSSLDHLCGRQLLPASRPRQVGGSCTYEAGLLMGATAWGQALLAVRGSSKDCGAP